MLKIILQDDRYLRPFNERARDLRVMNKPLWLAQRDILAPYTHREMELPCDAPLPETVEPCIVYRDNLYFDQEFIQAFLEEARQRRRPCRAAFSVNDPAFREHALPLSTSYTRHGELYLADLWYFPSGPTPEAEPLVIDLQSTEVGYYHVPTYMAYEQGDLIFQVPLRGFLAIDTWVHIFIADVIFGLFTRGARFEARLKNDPIYKLRILGRAMYEGKQVLSCSELVQVGHNCVIDPDAVIHGPTTIGNNVTIGAGAVIENCIIGDNANISQGCQLMLSVVGDGAFMPFRASLFMSTVMDNSMVAQNTCLQMSVVGRNTFLGAGTTFTDYNLLPAPIRAIGGSGGLTPTNRPVLGGCVGHNCRIGAGMIIFPARTIESDVVLFASEERRVISRDVFYEDSDHHGLAFKDLHPRLYPRQKEEAVFTWA
jgi:UDP-N-acetylglucosamine diphosphorylase / glucose-1-phosphate thymidylyltransferase / UDP-N-acetylgalactosamine diphosphorylase / glucosamine-1-phosphate N-acetyltransferase / galactosamine-1-phosphate N-acetyltransferase